MAWNDAINTNDWKRGADLNKCRCGSTKISITDIQTRTIIKCRECGREIKRRTLKKAEEAWNKNNHLCREQMKERFHQEKE